MALKPLGCREQGEGEMGEDGEEDLEGGGEIKEARERGKGDKRQGDYS